MKGKIVLITGASVGIGAATAKAFAERGAKVVITYHSGEEDAQETAEDCDSEMVLQLDVTKPESCRACVEKVKGEWGRIDVLVNNAGVAVWKQVNDQSVEEIQRQVRVNLEGLMVMTKQALPFVTETIINISSGAGKIGYAEIAPYCATKFGVRGFTQGLAKETDLRVVSVNPGMTATRMTGYKGIPPEEVAQVIVAAAQGEYGVASGGDVDVWEHA